MPFSHQKQITLKDILRYEDAQIKYECLPQIAFSNSEIFTVVLLECRGSCVLCAGWHQGMNFSAVIWFGRHRKWIALVSQEHRYLDCWMKMKYRMMQVSERSVEMLPFVWCSWQFWELCRWWAIMLFAHVSFGNFCLLLVTFRSWISKSYNNYFFAPMFILRWHNLSENTFINNLRVPPQP